MEVIGSQEAKAVKVKRNSIFKKTETQTRLFVLFAVGPAFVAYVLLNLYPNILSLYYSFFQWDGIGEKAFVGLYNYVEMIKDPFMWRALSHNFILILIIPVSIILITVVLSDMVINRGLRESNFYKVLFFFPNVMSVVVIGLLWGLIYDGNFGLLNAILKSVGIDVGSIYWLGDTRTALLAVAIPMIWSGIGWLIIIVMNAMAAIPKSLYEVAVIEGASDNTRLFKITIPLISGVIRVGAIFIFLSLLKSFDIILVLTRGGPGGATDVVGLYMFSYAFGGTFPGASSGTNYGYASAIGTFLFAILVGVKLLSDKLVSNETIEY